MIPTLQLGGLGMRGGSVGPAPLSFVSLLHFDGSDTSTTFTDVSGRTWTANGNAQLSTTSPLVGSASGLFDGTGDYIETPATLDLDLGSLNFKMEASIKFSSLPSSGDAGTILGRWAASNLTYWWFVYNNGGTYELRFYQSQDGATQITKVATWTPSTGVKYDLAVARDGTDFRFFVDGTQLGSTLSIAGAFAALSATLRIGGIAVSPFYYFAGRVDEVRITLNQTITANYTPSLPFADT